MGAALLMLEERVSGLKELLAQTNEWFLSLMDIVMVITPAIPFVCVIVIVAGGSVADLLNG